MLSAACSLVFVAILAISAYWDPRIRVLHVFEAVPYLAAGWLCVRRVKAGYMLAIAGGVVWLLIAGMRTTFVRDGFRLAGRLLQTGRVEQADVLIAAPAALATAGMALFGAWGYLRVRDKSFVDVGLLAGATVCIVGYFVAIFAMCAPQYLPLITVIFS